MTYIIPKSFNQSHIYLNRHKHIHKLYYSLNNLRLMGVPFILSKDDYTVKNRKIFLENKDLIDKFSELDKFLYPKIDNYSPLLVRDGKEYFVNASYKMYDRSKDIYLCVYKVVNNFPQIYIVDK